MLIQTTRTLVSLGTERMLVEFGKSGWIDKAKSQPDRVRQVLDKIKTDGLLPTIETVMNKLDQPIPLGYCNVGVVIEVGEEVCDLKVGDRVASNGPHAEQVCIPRNLAVPIPDAVSDEEAVFTVIGSIALQGIRLLAPTFGETVVVFGLGLIGLLAVQLLRAQGIRVIGIDLDQDKLNRAKSYGADVVAGGEDAVAAVMELTDQVGADGVLITASSSSQDIISQSARMSRQRGKIVLIGVIGLNINRDDFYKKELSFQVSCSYGPGRYDADYEEKGNDYPLPYVRWTERRNFEAVLQTIASGQLKVRDLISKQVQFEKYEEVYSDLKNPDIIAALLKYLPSASKIDRTILSTKPNLPQLKATVGCIGSGSFTSAIILPNLKRAGAFVKVLCSAKGLSSAIQARRFSIPVITTDSDVVLNDADVTMVVISTPHNSHAGLVVDALKAGKHVFVEKPLAIDREQLVSIVNAFKVSKGSVMVGYNRRFSSFTKLIKSKLVDAGMPINLVMTINAGAIPKTHWTQDMNVGGGRILGEGCHFIDLAIHLTGSFVKSVSASHLGNDTDVANDNVMITLKHRNGSQTSINYLANGSKIYSKERIEIYQNGRTLVLDNWRLLSGFGYKRFSKLKGRQDKGHAEQFKEWTVRVQKGGQPLISFEELVNGTTATLATIESIQKKNWIEF